MKDFGEIPGGKNELKDLLYPFYLNLPYKIWSKYRWWKNSKLSYLLPKLNDRRAWLTVIDRLGAPGDAIITANVIRCIKEKYPKILINCITPNEDLLKFDPRIDSLNKPETFFSFDSSYWELIVRKENKQNIIEHNLKKIGIIDYEYKARFFLNDEEIEWSRKELGIFKKPKIAICTMSKEPVKNWPKENWAEIIQILNARHTVIHLGDDNEPLFDGVIRYAGKLSMRQSAAILSHASYFIGPDSLLMHIANGLNIPSLILFGGSRPIECFGYKDNTNLATKPECSPCWIHHGYEECKNDLICMKELSTSFVLASLRKIQNN